jgi:regulator of replication initiation timing
MNPLVAQQIKELGSQVDELRRELMHAREQLEAMSASREEMQRKSWSLSREVHVLRERLDQVGELQNENARYKSMVKDFEQRLRDVLKFTQALATQLRQ